MRFKANKDNKEYITIDKIGLTTIAVICEKRNIKLSNEATSIFSKLIQFEVREKIPYVHDIEIRKDSILGQFLINNPFKENIVNDDLIVDYDKVVSAFNIAVFQNNEIARKILPLFQNPNELELENKKLVEKYGKEVIDFILENNDFSHYLIKLDENASPTKYIVYEDDKFSRKSLVEKNKQLLKK